MQRRPPKVHTESRGCAAVASAQSRSHARYEDRFRLLCDPIPLVRESRLGEIVAVFDGIGDAPEGMAAAQHMADALLRFYKQPHRHPDGRESLRDLLLAANQEIYEWGFIPDTNRPLGGCAGTIAWLTDGKLSLFHAGDTVAWVQSPRGWVRRTTHHGEGKVLYRYFGLGPSLVVEVRTETFNEGDRVLIVSDGVTKVLGETEITDIIDGESTPERAVDRLASAAQVAGSPDDITVLLFERGEEE